MTIATEPVPAWTAVLVREVRAMRNLRPEGHSEREDGADADWLLGPRAHGLARHGVDVARLAQLLARMEVLPQIREDLVERIRSEIADGRYLTAAKLAMAAEVLADELVV